MKACNPFLEISKHLGDRLVDGRPAAVARHEDDERVGGPSRRRHFDQRQLLLGREGGDGAEEDRGKEKCSGQTPLGNSGRERRYARPVEDGVDFR